MRFDEVPMLGMMRDNIDDVWLKIYPVDDDNANVILLSRGRFPESLELGSTGLYYSHNEGFEYIGQLSIETETTINTNARIKR